MTTLPATNALDKLAMTLVNAVLVIGIPAAVIAIFTQVL